MSARAALARGVKGLARTVDRLGPTPRGLVVLIYHRVGSGASIESDLPTEVFRRQMADLAERGVAISLDDGLAWLAAGGGGAADPVRVAVTFDDGTADFVDHALPVLVDHGVPATYYLATDHLERGVEFSHGGTPATWAAMAEAMSTGLVTVGSHTHTHLLLDRVTPVEAAADLDRSTELLRERLGVEAAHFAYPKALLASAAVEPEVRRRFRSAAIGGCRANRPGLDVHRLRRTPIQRSDTWADFRAKAAGGMWVEDALRTTANRVRYRGASS